MKLEKENKYNKKKTRDFKVFGVATACTVALSIGLSAAAFALFNKLNKILPLDTKEPMETFEPIETIKPIVTPIESPIVTPIESPIVTPIESIVPTPTPTPTMSEEEILLGGRYNHDLKFFGEPLITEIKVNNEKKIIITNLFIDQYEGRRFFVDYFSQIPLFYLGDLRIGESDAVAIGAYKGKSLELIDLGSMKNDVPLRRITGVYVFDITKYLKVKDLLEWYKRNIPEKERIPIMPYLKSIEGQDNIVKWNEDYTGPFIENSNIDYINNILNAESLNNNVIEDIKVYDNGIVDKPKIKKYYIA